MPKGHWKNGNKPTPPSRLGTKTSLETKKKLSLASSGSKNYFYGKSFGGKKHWNWKGGIMKNKIYRNWLKNKRNRMKRTILGEHTFGDWEILKKQYNFSCPACGRSEPDIQLTEDHIIPVSKGGSNNIENIQPLCKSCNSRKHNKIVYYIKGLPGGKTLTQLG